MKEDFLHYIWQHQYFDKAELKTVDGEALQVKRVGFLNTEAGPDFKESIIRIGDVEWAGSVEIHLKASDWLKHQHQSDSKYEQVILHVVWEADKDIKRQEGSTIPVVELRGRVDLGYIHTYEQLQRSKDVIPCAAFWPNVPELTKLSMLERSLIERLEQKGNEVMMLYKSYGNDWEQTAYHVLLKSFGFKTNQIAFEQLAKAIPLKVLRQHQNSNMQLEALLYGQAGFLNNVTDAYMQNLQKEHVFLSHKYQLKAMQPHYWNFLRMRPGNFPTVRLAQLAAILFQGGPLFAKLLELNTIKAYEEWFRSPVSAYWQEHYMPGKKAARKQISMGQSSAHNLIINTVVPLLSAYANYTNDTSYLDKAVYLLEQVKEASNKYTRLYESLGWQAKTAADNQAALSLYKNYCAPVNCLYCSIGNRILKQHIKPV